MKKGLLVSYDQTLKNSSLYLGYVILESIQKTKKITIFELYDLLKKEDRNFNYTNMIYALMFLYMNDLVCFTEPYIHAKTQ